MPRNSPTSCVPDIEQRGWPVFEVSTVSREGLRELTFALWDLVSAYRPRCRRWCAAPRSSGRLPVDETGFTVARHRPPRWFRGPRQRPERWIAQTNFDNDEAVGYLGDRLARLGVEDATVQARRQTGCAVTIGDMTFDWEPQTPAGWTS